MTTNNWWANKLAGQPPSYPPVQQPVYQPPVQQQPVYQPPMPQQQPQLPPSAASARCPGCGSGNYGSSALAPEAKARCYDCGYPIIQSGSGLGTGVKGVSGSGPAIPARQSTTANNFNPQGIIGHI